MVLLLIATWIIAAYNWSDWRNWQNYYPTILFFIAGDLIYNFIAYNNPLWELTSPHLGVTFTVLLVSITMWSASTLLKIAFYILIWVVLFTLVELVLTRFQYIRYSNGWNIGWSILFDAVMFPLLKIHHEKPQLAWFLTLILGGTITYLCIPLSSIK